MNNVTLQTIPISKKTAVALMDLQIAAGAIGIAIMVASFFMLENRWWFLWLLAANYIRGAIQDIYIEEGKFRYYVLENFMYVSMAVTFYLQIPNYGLYFALPWLSLLFVDVAEYIATKQEGSSFYIWRTWVHKYAKEKIKEKS